MNYNCYYFRWENTNVDKNESLVVLEPDHPLMQKFQTTLNTFLEKENERVRIEILELVLKTSRVFLIVI